MVKFRRLSNLLVDIKSNTKVILITMTSAKLGHSTFRESKCFKHFYFEGDTVYICGGSDHENQCHMNGRQKVDLILCTVLQIGKKKTHTTFNIQDGSGWTPGPDLVAYRYGLTLNRKIWLLI
jgi:hypothetical protein